MTRPIEQIQNTSGFKHSIELRGIPEHVCYAMTSLITKGPFRRFNPRERAPNNRYDSKQNYLADRLSNVEDYRQLFSPFSSFKDKVVLDLGCSSGYLLDAFLKLEKFTAIGADISAEALARARTRCAAGIRYIQTTPTSIPLPDNSVDITYTIDTVEHLSRPRDIFQEVYRVLKPGGQFLVHFGPWYGPCATHLEDIIPIPWMNVVFSMDTLLNVAAYIYEQPDHKHACYWYDDNDRLRPNPYLDREKWREFLNDLTLRKFNRMLKDLPFETAHFQRIGFGGKSFRAAKLFSGLAQVPVLNELFIKAVFCVLRKKG